MFDGHCIIDTQSPKKRPKELEKQSIHEHRKR